jgi:crossover junction endonuclease MUS81
MPQLPRDPEKRQQALEACANAHFALWIHEWHQEAIRRESRLQFTYRRALQSILGHPVRLANGQEASRLPGIGPFIAARLDQRLTEHVRSGGSWHCPLFSHQSAPIIERPLTAMETGSVFGLESNGVQLTPRYLKPTSSHGQKTARAYMPAFRSAPFAVLLALIIIGGKDQSDGDGAMDRHRLMQEGQQWCKDALESTTLANALTLLQAKGLVQTGPRGHRLTPSGRCLARRLFATTCPHLSPHFHQDMCLGDDDDDHYDDDNNDDNSYGDGKEGCMTNRLERWPANSFNLWLIVDLREVKSRTDRDFFLDRLTSLGLRVAQRALPVGDFLWVAAPRSFGAEDVVADSVSLVVLDTVVERKTEQDFASSVPDGRFREQKGRLARCRLERVIYLVEERGSLSSDALRIGWEQYFAARTQTFVVDKFFVRLTRSLTDTVAFLASVHRNLERRFSDQDLAFFTCPPPSSSSAPSTEQPSSDTKLMNLTTFTRLTSKSANLTVRQVWANQLQAVKGVSRERAIQLSTRFPSPAHLIDFFRRPSDDSEIDSRDGVKELADLPLTQRRLGQVVARRLHDVCTLAAYSVDHQ